MIRPMHNDSQNLAPTAIPDKEAIALLQPFERLELDRITLVSTGPQAREAFARLANAPAWGFDTESKPTFKVGELSDGPHTLQLATAEHGWVIQLHDPQCRDIAAELLALGDIVQVTRGGALRTGIPALDS